MQIIVKLNVVQKDVTTKEKWLSAEEEREGKIKLKAKQRMEAYDFYSAQPTGIVLS